MSESRTPDEMFDSIVELVREAQSDGHSLLVVSATELPDGGLSMRHGMANLEKYGMSMAMLSDLIILVSRRSEKPLETVVTDVIRALKGISGMIDDQTTQTN